MAGRSKEYFLENERKRKRKGTLNITKVQLMMAGRRKEYYLKNGRKMER